MKAIFEQQDERLPLTRGQQLESEVRAYCRNWPTVFARATGSRVFDADGRPYLDFFAGAGSLNYGHNDPVMKERLLAYLQDNGIIQGLDTTTTAKVAFLDAVDRILFEPRGMSYRVQFTGPTGANAVEAALKLARKVTGRRLVVSFTRAFHGMSLGALAVSGSRTVAGSPTADVLRLPFEGFGRHGTSGLDLLEDLLQDGNSGVDLPAAVIVETVQAEGGVRVASTSWLRRLAHVCGDLGILLIVDDIQAGCGRTGPFFSHELHRLAPDLICVSKSISGYGLPMALVLIKPGLDVWSPGEHNGTFRGNNAAFVTAEVALTHYWADESFPTETLRKGALVRERLSAMQDDLGQGAFEIRGRGLLNGLDLGRADLAQLVCQAAFTRGLLVETSGSDGEVVKLLPPLTISDDDLVEGLDILEASVRSVLESCT